MSQQYPERRAEAGDVIQAHPALRDYLKANQGDFTALEEFVE